MNNYLISLGVLILVSAVAIRLLMRKSERRPKRDVGLRRFEASILVALTLPLFFVLAFPRRLVFDEFTAWDLIKFSEGGLIVALAIVIAIAVIVAVWSCSLKSSTSIATLLLGIAIILGISNLNNSSPLVKSAVQDHLKARAESSQRTLGQVRIELTASIPGAEVSINGVSFGKLPCQTSFRELLSKIPDGDTFHATKKSDRPGVVVSLATELHRYARQQGIPRKDVEPIQGICIEVVTENAKSLIYQPAQQIEENDGLLRIVLDVQFEEWPTQIKQLIDRARLENYEPSADWYDAFLSFETHGWNQLKELAKKEPELSGVMDGCAKRRYGIHDKMDAQQAWDVLGQIVDEAIAAGEYDTMSCMGRAVELFAAHLDPQQLASGLLAVPDERWPRISSEANQPRPWFFRDADDNDSTALKPLFHAAWHIDYMLHQQNPDEYNIIETAIGDALFVRSSPQRTPRALAEEFAIPKLLDRLGSLDPLERSRARNAYLEFSKFAPPVFGSPLADEYVRRQAQPEGAAAITKALGNNHILSTLATRSGLALPAGETVELGSARIDSWYRELIFLDSPLGREFRRTHRQELLELAMRSLGPIEKKELAEEDKNLSQVLGALQSVLLQNANTAGKWPIPHLEFVFLDQHDGNTEPSLALEFWRYFDALVDTIPSLKDEDRLKLRWLYLARLWPESDIEMFVAVYFKTPLKPRQLALVDPFASNRGLPESIPVSVRLQILERLLEKVSTLPKLETENTDLWKDHPLMEIYPHRPGPKNELESIKWAVSDLDCPEGAASFVELRAAEFSEFEWQKDSYQRRMESLNLLLGHFVAHGGGLFHRDDRIVSFAQHDDPALRRIAIAVLRDRPIPRFVRLLPQLMLDPDAAVREEAVKANDELEAIRKGNLPHRQI